MELLAQSRSARLLTEVLPIPAAPSAVLELLAGQPDPAVLESSALHETFGRYSLFACRPVEVLTLRDGRLRDRSGKILAADEGIWTGLASAFGAVKVEDSAQAGYAPGWIGYIGYEVGRHIERLPGRAVRDTALPDLRLGFYDAVLVFDAVRRDWRLIRLDFDSPPTGAGEAAQTLRSLLVQAGQLPPEQPPRPTELADAAPRPTARTGSNFTPRAYQQAVRRCVEYIAAGDIFQVNLSQRLALPEAPEPLAIYQALRRRNPAWYAAYIAFDSPDRPCAVLSGSPELFLRVRGRDVLTRPIKGTRPRVGDADRDAKAAAELLASAKDHAELAMIIDLLRNDLGRVCEFGSVKVTDPCRLETHPTVFHLVGTVVGRLAEGIGPAELLRATFPGGSITGAPKIRAMEIIDELEGLARGVYTGCIGIVGVNGTCEWNIAIRTMVWEAGRAYIQVGGGVVADSTPRGEYQETLDKARAMLEAVAEAQQVAASAPKAGKE